MENREDALDFIYKGWREGRQQRRNVVRQRGLDRTRSMLGPIMAQRARGSMASMPPSMPVEETRVPTEPSPVENVEETVSMPPASPVPEDDMTDDITNPTDHPDDFENQMVQPTPRENTPVLPSPVSRPVQPYAGQEEEERRIEEAKAEAAEARRKHSFAGAEYDADSPSGRVLQAVEESVAEKKKNQSPPKEQTPVKEEEKPPEHKKAFEEAYPAMVEEATQLAAEKISSPPKATKKGKEEVMRLGDNLARWGIFGEGDEEPSDN